jgi:hypothetical protein
MKANIDNLTKQESELLSQAQAVASVVESKGWKDVIYPYLLSMVEWPNPKTYPTIEEMILPYTQAYGEAEAIRKLNQFVDNNLEMMKSLTKKAEGKDVVSSYKI